MNMNIVMKVLVFLYYAEKNYFRKRKFVLHKEMWQVPQDQENFESKSEKEDDHIYLHYIRKSAYAYKCRQWNGGQSQSVTLPFWKPLEIILG